jgi:dimeric dUTPase (all-alpha-NTP-PPase superfamily)
MLLENQAATMLQLQDKMNAKVNPDWLAVKSPFLRAVVIEGSEAIEHHGWKWWKKQECDLEQLQMELVDIWHFLLSAVLIKHDGDQQASKATVMAQIEGHSVDFDGQTYQFSELELLAKLELLIGLSAAKRINIGLFTTLLADCQMSWVDLYTQYICKNVLNFFRQDNGYKQGTYIKIWAGKEDNEHLVEIMAELDAADAAFQDNLYEALDSRYKSLNA